MDLQYAEHHIYRLEYHLVWTPKYRHPVFREPQRTVLKNILLISLPPPISISECIRILKSISAREFFQKFPEIKTKYFWGGKLWSPSYYAETIGKRNEEVIRKYIQNQLREEAKYLQTLKQLKLF